MSSRLSLSLIRSLTHHHHPPPSTPALISLPPTTPPSSSNQKRRTRCPHRPPKNLDHYPLTFTSPLPFPLFQVNPSKPCMVCSKSTTSSSSAPPSSPSTTHSHTPSPFTPVSSAGIVAVAIATGAVVQQQQPVLMEIDHAQPNDRKFMASVTTTSCQSPSVTVDTSPLDNVPVETSNVSASEHDDITDALLKDSDSASQPAVEVSTSTVTTASEMSVRVIPEDKTKDGVQHQRVLTFRTGIVCIPHPEKVKKGGEDAYFVHKSAMGVFDGVGGWASIGVDAGLYSKELARLTAQYVQVEGPASVVDGLKLAKVKNRAIGSSTACVVGLDGDTLVGINLGDSGLMVVRDGVVVYRTTEQQHYFNCPFQIGTDSLDTVDVGCSIDVKLEHGDWIIMGTDGLWDNVFPNKVVDVVVSHAGVPEEEGKSTEQVKSCKSGGDGNGVGMGASSSSDGLSAASDNSVMNEAEEAQTIAQELAECALKVANDERGSSPFAVNAQNAGHMFLGGKLDDITIVTALVVDPEVESCGKGDGVKSQMQHDTRPTAESRE